MLRQWFASLVNRAVAFVSVSILVAAVTVTIVNSIASRHELESQAKAQVDTLAGVIAGELDNKLAERFDVLTHVVADFAMEEAVFRDRAQLLLNRQIAMRHLFDAFYLFAADGEVIAEYPRDYQQTGLNASNREYFKQTSDQLTALISEPFRASHQDLPAIMMTAPIFDHRKRFIGVIGGAIVLTSDNFLGEIADIRVGKTGYVGVASRAGLTLAHGREQEIMQPLPLSNRTLMAAMQGFEGTAYTNNSNGVGTVMAVRQMDQAPWFVAVVWPEDEAFAPVARLTDILAWIVVGVLVILTPIALLVFRRLMSPMRDLAEQITERHQGMRNEPVNVGGGREIDQVAETFNVVMAERTEVMDSLAEREAFFRSLSQSAPVGIVQTDVLGRIEFVNPAFERIMGISASELANSYLIAGVYKEDRPGAIRAWRDALRNNQVFRGQFRLRHAPSGQLIWVDAMTASIDTPEKSIGTITIVRDITHELEVESELRDEQLRAESILGVLQEGVLMVDTKGDIRYANRAACSFLGVTDGCEQHNFFDVIEVERDGQTVTRDEFLNQGAMESLNGVLKNTRGQRFDVELTMLRLSRGETGERMVFVLRDDSERRREEQRLSWEATHDSLTGLLNRRAFTASLVKWLGEAENLTAPSMLMLIDLDYFKPVNDQGGHLLGDDLLRYLAQLLTDSVRQSDTVARLGGDEFGIILPACGVGRAEALAESIRAGVEAVRVGQDGEDYGVTASIGLTQIAASDANPRETVARADEGCYAAKAQGRNRVVMVPVPPDELEH